MMLLMAAEVAMVSKMAMVVMMSALAVALWLCWAMVMVMAKMTESNIEVDGK